MTGTKPEDLRRAAIISVLAAIACAVMPAAALAQSAVNINLGTGAGLTDRVVQLVALMTVLSLAPSIVIMTTSFVRIVVVLGLLRTAIGIQSSPPNPVIISLALFLTAIVMGPTFERLVRRRDQAAAGPPDGAARGVRRRRRPGEAVHAAPGRPRRPGPVRAPVQDPQTQNAQALPLQVVTPAFMISELKRAFEIGFLLFIPFLVIDLVVASVLMSMGMMMLPPATISLPFKLIFFVLVDGWRPRRGQPRGELPARRRRRIRTDLQKTPS
ncbi:flagellar type III secretion system pore protein FliP [Caulobacter segnis]